MKKSEFKSRFGNILKTYRVEYDVVMFDEYYDEFKFWSIKDFDEAWEFLKKSSEWFPTVAAFCKIRKQIYKESKGWTPQELADIDESRRGCLRFLELLIYMDEYSKFPSFEIFKNIFPDATWNPNVSYDKEITKKFKGFDNPFVSIVKMAQNAWGQKPYEKRNVKI